MKKRRDFLKTAGALTIGLPLLGNAISCKSENKSTMKSTVKEAMNNGFTIDDFGIQLWSVRDAMYNDAKGTLKLLSDYGYKTIESMQGDQGVFWNMSPREYASFLSDHGLKTYSSHCNGDYAIKLELRDEFKKLVDDAAEVGFKYLVNPFMGDLKSIDEFKSATQGFNELGEICKANDIKYCYHNHHYSFQPIEGILPQDIMMNESDPDLVGFEMDFYWVDVAGHDPIDWLKKHSHRFELCHVKDRYKDDKLEDIYQEEGNGTDDWPLNVSCVVGTGRLNMPEIMQVAKANGMKQFIVEQERYDDMTSMDAARLNAEYMKKFVA